MSRHQFRKTQETPERKLSIFERLGSKYGGQKNDSAICREWIKTGFCSLGKVCKLANTHLAISGSKLLKRGAMKKKNSSGKKSTKVGHRRSNSGEPPSGPTCDKWDVGDLEGADEKDLQKRRIQLQRELKLQMKRERGISKKKKPDKRVARSPSTSSSTTSGSSSSASSSSDSSARSRKKIVRKRKISHSSCSDGSFRRKKKKVPKSPSKLKVVVKKKLESPRKPLVAKKSVVVRKSPSPSWERRNASPKRKSPVRPKPRLQSPKHKARDASPRRVPKSKDRRASPPRSVRPRSAERRRHHSPRRRREAERGGLEKGGKILPVKAAAYLKEVKESARRKSAERLREEKEKDREKDKEKRRREQKAREAERREREREAERLRRESERQKEREDALERCRERQRERDRLERSDRDKRSKEFERKEVEQRKAEVKSELPSLLDIKTEAPRDSSGRAWDERRSRRTDENFEFRRVPREEHDATDTRRGRKVHEFIHEPVGWDSSEEFREPPPTGEWSRDWKPRYEQKWSGENSREGVWRDQYAGRRSEWHVDASSSEDPIHDDRPSGDLPRRIVEPPISDGPIPIDAQPAEVAGDLEEALSDISDDPDDILNQVDEHSIELGDSHSNQQPPVCSSQPGPEFFFDHRKPLLDCLGERGLDFEEISDEDLEEEARMSKGIMDVLGADWASLMKQTPVKTTKVDGAGSALRRWRIDAIIARLGISRDYLGGKSADDYITMIKKQCLEADKPIGSVKKEVEEFNVKVGVDDDEKQIKAMNIKEEEGHDGVPPMDEDVKHENSDDCVEDQLTFLHRIPAIHATLHETRGQSTVQRLMSPRFKKALSARTDLSIRRVLCGYSVKEPIHVSGCEQLYENSVALFKSAAA